jgi:hypothetical protein
VRQVAGVSKVSKAEADSERRCEVNERPTDRQVGGNHYQMPIQPVEFIQRNNLGFCEGNVVKYVCRHKTKGGAEDVKKAIHYLELLLQLEYSE